VTQLLTVKHLVKHFPVRGGLLQRTRAKVHAVDDVSFDLERGQTLGLVGESGCGKSTLGRCLVRLHQPTSGEVWLEDKNLTKLSQAQMRRERVNIQMIFQDPYASLNPRMTVEEILMEPLNTHAIGDKHERKSRVRELLGVVGLREQVMQRYPHEFSGGQRQRVGIARALAVRPKLIVADEPVSALDVSVQAQVLNLIADLQREFGISFLFIAHDLAVVQHISHRVGVMYLGQLVELTDSETLYRFPFHPYTQALLSAVPVTAPSPIIDRIEIKGEVPSPLNPPKGCRFHTRCPSAKDICRSEKPTLENMKTPGKPDHWVACHLYEKVTSPS
jgi:oligopeptide transport system ATP-binding protein